MLDVSGFKPSYNPNQSLIQIANTLQEDSRYKQERDYRNKKEQEAKAQQNKLYNLREIDQDTDPTKFKTGEQRFDDYTQKELSAIKNKALTEYINLDPVEAEYKLSKDMQGLIGWHNAVKSKIENTKTGLTDFNKTYPNINLQKAHDISFLEIGNDFLEKDKDGNIVRKEPSLVKERDYVSELNTPDRLSEIVEDVTPFAKYIQSFKPQKIGAKEYSSKRGYSVKHGYTGEITPFSEVETDEDGKPIGVKLQSEEFKFGDKGVLKMIPERQFEQMMEVPQVRASIIGMWGKHKAQFEKETGSKITPANEDKMLRGFLYDEIKNNNLDQHSFRPDDAVVTPRITINNGGRPTKAEIAASTPLNLSNYPQEGKEFVVTKLAPGIKVTGLPDGKTLSATKIKFNPDTKEVTTTDVMGNTVTEDFETFRQNIATINTGVDLSFIDRLKVTGRPGISSITTSGKSNKIVSTATLKSLIGTKGYEGYSLQELVDYYKSNGYKVDK